MDIFLLRHAIALDRAKWSKKDADRPLTKAGQKKMRREAKGLKRLKLSVDWILTSPHRRAFDTAAIVAKALKAKKKMKVVPQLAANGDPKALMKRLALDYRTDDRLLLVGHDPYLSRLVSKLIGAAAPLALDFKKGGLCRLSADTLQYGPCATLEWWLPPKLLKKI
jgi:phosphohistidine phosphatase